jgi:hypothetical protein
MLRSPSDKPFYARDVKNALASGKALPVEYALVT